MTKQPRTFVGVDETAHTDTTGKVKLKRLVVCPAAYLKFLVRFHKTLSTIIAKNFLKETLAIYYGSPLLYK